MAKISFEIELDVSGTVVPYREATGPTYSSGGEPAEGGYAEDVTIEDIGIIESNPDFFKTGVIGASRWKTTSLLTGIDTYAPEIQKLFANILAMKEAEAQDALMDDAA